MKRGALILGLLLTSCSNRRPYEDLARALTPPVRELCSLQRKDSEAVGCGKTCAVWRNAEEARILERAASGLVQIPPFTGGETTKRLVVQMQEQAAMIGAAYQLCGPPKANRTGEPPPDERACADRRIEARMLKAEADLEDLLTKIARAPDRPEDVEMPDPARCSK